MLEFDTNDKFIVNLGYGPQIYVILPDLKINDNQIEFRSPIILDENSKSIKNDGYNLYFSLMFINLLNEPRVKTPLNQSSDGDFDLVFSDIHFHVDVAEPMLLFSFTVDKGFYNGFENKIETLDKTGIYLLDYNLHKNCDWWEKFKIEDRYARIAIFYDMTINNNTDFSESLKEFKEANKHYAN